MGILETLRFFHVLDTAFLAAACMVSGSISFAAEKAFAFSGIMNSSIPGHCAAGEKNALVGLMAPTASALCPSSSSCPGFSLIVHSYLITFPSIAFFPVPSLDFFFQSFFFFFGHYSSNISLSKHFFFFNYLSLHFFLSSFPELGSECLSLILLI